MEKEVFSDVVLRFRVYIKVRKLDGVVGFCVQECAEILRLMQRCHDVTEAHNPSAFLKDIEDTKAVVKLIHNRKNGPAAKGATPVAKAATGP